MQVADVLSRLRALSDPQVAAALERSGSHPRSALGVPQPQLRQLAAEIGIDRLIAQQLWASGIHEARLLASMIDDPERVTSKQMERWVRDFDTWDLCDACCENLFHKTPFAFGKVSTWSARREEYVKRAAFVLLGELADNAKGEPNAEFSRFLPVVEREAGDDRPLVRKAIAGALRRLGGRNAALQKIALATATTLDQHHTRSGRWIASDALKELRKAPPARKKASVKKAAKKAAKKAPAKKKKAAKKTPIKKKPAKKASRRTR
jgi:3-methyladenine DNA glycosylase AlkD